MGKCSFEVDEGDEEVGRECERRYNKVVHCKFEEGLFVFT